MDPFQHRQYTGAGNRRILENLQALALTGADIQVRIPLIEGVNTDNENIEATASFIAALAGPPKLVNLLPYHNVAEGKSAKLGEPFEADGMRTPGAPVLDEIINRFAELGLTAIVGG